MSGWVEEGQCLGGGRQGEGWKTEPASRDYTLYVPSRRQEAYFLPRQGALKLSSCSEACPPYKLNKGSASWLLVKTLPQSPDIPGKHRAFCSKAGDSVSLLFLQLPTPTPWISLPIAGDTGKRVSDPRVTWWRGQMA